MDVIGGEVTESLTGQAFLPFTVTVAPSLVGPVTVDFATADGTAIANQDYTPVSGTLHFGPGQVQQTVLVPVFREFISAQDKTLSLNLSNVIGSGPLILTNSSAVGTIHYISTVSLPLSAIHRASYTDYLNHRVIVQLAGPGTGNVVFLGTTSTATDAYELVLDGTTAASTLTIRSAGVGQTSFGNIIVTGSMGAIIGRNSNLIGAVNVSGSLNTLSLNYVAASSINVGAGVGTLGLAFGRVLDTSITSAIPIRSITANAYLNTDGVPDQITAPSVGTIRVKGNFGGTIQAQTLGALVATGSIQNASILTTGSIGTIVASDIQGSNIFAGVRAGLDVMPTSSDDFVNTKGAHRRGQRSPRKLQ